MTFVTNDMTNGIRCGIQHRGTKGFDLNTESQRAQRDFVEEYKAYKLTSCVPLTPSVRGTQNDNLIGILNYDTPSETTFGEANL